MSNFVNVEISLKLELFDKLIEPILSYGSEVWGFHPAPDIEKIQTRFWKRILYIKTSTPNDIARRELGRNELSNRRYTRIIKYWLKLLHSPQHKYIYQIYISLYNSNVNGQTNGCTKVEKLLYNLGMGDAWYFQTVGDISNFI